MSAHPAIVKFIREYAASIGIDPDVAERVSRTEALNVFDPSKPDRGGDLGSSFGPFQLHYGGIAKGMSNPGLGDAFTKATGLDARDPSTWPQQVKFALDTAKKDGWRQWMGAANNGIPRWAGIDPNAKGSGATPVAEDTASGTYDPRRDTPSYGRPTGEKVSQYALEHPVGPQGDDVTTSPANIEGNPYALPAGTQDSPLITEEKEKSWNEKLGEGIAGGLGKITGKFGYDVPNPVPGGLARSTPAPMIDPATSQNQRMMLAYALQRLNAGKLA